MNFADLMVYAGIKQDTFRGGCFAGINMSHDADISCFFKRIFSAHDICSLSITSDNGQKPYWLQPFYVYLLSSLLLRPYC